MSCGTLKPILATRCTHCTKIDRELNFDKYWYSDILERWIWIFNK